MAEVYLACYKGKPRAGASIRDRLPYLLDGIIRIFTNSPYSHCELVIPNLKHEGMYYCYSASMRENKVRMKYMALPKERWDLFPTLVQGWYLQDFFEAQRGKQYDYRGVLSFVLPFLTHNPQKWFCSEFCASALSLSHPEKYSPAKVHQALL